MSLRHLDVLADTWWYGTTNRLSDDAFTRLAALRAQQGFSAVQIVVGIPPEVGPRHPSAASAAGPAWTLDGTINKSYLALARLRLEALLATGLTPIVYGAWGPQIEWLDVAGMIRWWDAVVDALDDLPVVYCLCGESNLALRFPRAALAGEAGGASTSRLLSPLRGHLRAVNGARRWLLRRHRRERQRRWTEVLRHVRRRTSRPLIIHPVVDESGCRSVLTPEHLDIETFQTGHSEASRSRLHGLRSEAAAHNRSEDWINLEPWYEGINGRFHLEDQLYSYWVCRLSGAVGHCYGAQGIWNVGDGRFLSHWGHQTFEQAVTLGTAWTLGANHRMFATEAAFEGTPQLTLDGGRLVSIAKVGANRRVTFFPAAPDTIAAGAVSWCPNEARFGPCSAGAVVTIEDGQGSQT